MKIVVVEDQFSFQKKMVSIIHQVLKEEKLEDLGIYCFTEYNKELKGIIHDKDTKIYLLDIELSGSSKSGYDISREIRQNAHDWKSVIIVCSVYNLKESFISARLAVLTYLSKLENFPINLKETFKIALGIFYQNDAVQINEHQKIYYHDILYALKEKYSKYCIIQTMDKQIRVRKNLKDLESELKLKKIKKHILANEENILSITHQEIVFKNKDSIKIE